jgi:dihydroneopterin aldolase/2-amino-4-hydroxy-6-hydroxymethyldihydropteridine diphosphokinase
LLPLDTVSVRIERGWHTAYLSIGSNMGDKEENLRRAVAALKEHPRIRDVRVSDLIETEPYGYVMQDWFLNGAVELQTILPPEELLLVLQKIEQDGHRERTIHWGPRTIDLDLLLYEDTVLQTEQLTLPHKEMHKREFVLEPLAQIAPWAVHPLYHRTVNELLDKMHEKKRGNEV